MTKAPVIMVVACAVLALAPGWANAEEEMQSPQPTPPPQKQSLMGNGLLSATLALYDVDNSGDLSVEEKQAMDADRRNRHERFRERWDTNKDGRVSPTEQTAARAKIRELIRLRRLQRFSEVDVADLDDKDRDGVVDEADGFLSLDEFSAINAVALSNDSNPGISEAIFNHVDEDGDGAISEAEFLKSLEPQAVDPTSPNATAPPRKARDTLSGD